jgi:hypothetical protein
MYSDEKFDELLHTACREKREELSKFGPDFRRIEAGVLTVYKKRSSKRRNTLILRTAVAVVSTVVLVNAFLIFAEIEPVKAYKEDIKKLVFNIFSSKTEDNMETQYRRVSNEIQKMQHLVPYSIPFPAWIPEGYIFEKVEMSQQNDDSYSVRIIYKKGDVNIIIDMSNDTSIANTLPTSEESNFEKERIDDTDAYFLITPNRSKCIFYDKQGLCIYISGNTDKQSLIRMMESMN